MAAARALVLCATVASAYLLPHAPIVRSHADARCLAPTMSAASAKDGDQAKPHRQSSAGKQEHNALVPVPLFTSDDRPGHNPQVSLDDDYDGDEFNEARRVLLIYTGGTLGMTKLPDGSLAPEKGGLARAIREMPEMRDPSMPELDFIEYDPLIDSSNVSPKDWAQLARQIRDNYYDYDGFVIAHGTDTMAYTASALSFMLEGLGKAVVLTGSMIPLAEVYNDARRNLLISMVYSPVPPPR